MVRSTFDSAFAAAADQLCAEFDILYSKVLAALAETAQHDLPDDGDLDKAVADLKAAGQALESMRALTLAALALPQKRSHQ